MAISIREAEKRVKAWEKIARVKKKPPTVVKRKKKAGVKRKRERKVKWIRAKVEEHHFIDHRVGKEYWKLRIHAVPKAIRTPGFKSGRFERRRTAEGEYIYFYPT